MITFEEVLNAWRNVEPNFKYRDKAVDKNGIRFIFPNGMYYEINTEQVYSNRKVFSMNVEQSLKAINLTVEYLKNRQIIESDNAPLIACHDMAISKMETTTQKGRIE